MSTLQHDVVVVGAGPAGLVLAAELALAGVDVRLLEQRPDSVLQGSRAGGFHARTLEVLDQRGIADRFLAEGTTVQAASLATTLLDLSDFPTRHPYTLGIWQNQIERILAEWVTELGVTPTYGTTVTGLTQHDDAATVHTSSGDLTARYVVGCDGGRSQVRKWAGIDFPGWDPTRSAIVGEVELTEEPPAGVRRDAVGVHGLNRMEGQTTYRVVVTEAELRSGDAGLEDLQVALRAVFGTDFGAHDPTWVSRFTDATRQAATYRAGRVLLAGDAAHIHYPAGGQGVSLGVQDAVNLGWKLAQVVKGVSPESLLDTYHDERHPVAARALRYTMAQAALLRTDDRAEALYELVGEVAVLDEARKHLAARHSGLDIRYDLGDGHPLLGRRVPDLDLEHGPFYRHLHAARPVLLDLAGGLTAPPHVELVRSSYDGVWELPAIGEVDPPKAVLVRPDGYVAWVGDGTDTGLVEAATRWFGAA